MTNTSVVSLAEPHAQKDGDTIQVFLKDCKVELRVGVYEAEMHKPQTVIINVEVEARLPHHYQDLDEKKLDRVIDYDPIYGFIHNELPQMGHIPLLETIAEQITTFCFRDIRIQKVRVRLEKTQALAGASAGIEISRTRQNS